MLASKAIMAMTTSNSISVKADAAESLGTCREKPGEEAMCAWRKRLQGVTSISYPTSCPTGKQSHSCNREHCLPGPDGSAGAGSPMLHGDVAPIASREGAILPPCQTSTRWRTVFSDVRRAGSASRTRKSARLPGSSVPRSLGLLSDHPGAAGRRTDTIACIGVSPARHQQLQSRGAPPNPARRVSAWPRSRCPWRSGHAGVEGGSSDVAERHRQTPRGSSASSGWPAYFSHVLRALCQVWIKRRVGCQFVKNAGVSIHIGVLGVDELRFVQADSVGMYATPFRSFMAVDEVRRPRA